MAAQNNTGLHRTEEYNLGRGIIYLAELDANNLPDGNGWRDVGNATEMNLTVEVEKLEHQSSRAGLKVTDKEVVVSQKLNVSATLDSINADNLATFLSGEVATYTNSPTQTGIAEIVNYIPSVKLGRWYDIKTTAYGASTPGLRAYDLQDSADLTLEKTPTTALVEGTDYKVDLVMGRFFLFTTAANITDGDGLDLTLAADATAKNMDETRGLTKTTKTVALKFISENPANADEPAEFQIHQISLVAEGDFGLISDEFSTMQLSGAAESNTTADSDSPTITVRCRTLA